MSARINILELQSGLQTKGFGRDIFALPEVTSTNEWAKDLARLGADEGTTVIAEIQTEAHGRLNRKWFSPRGGLWLSIILKPKIKAAEASKLVFVAGLAVAKTLHELYGLEVQLKWPNDVLVSARKICGILAEASIIDGKLEFVIVGVGLNANFEADTLPDQVKLLATSIETELEEIVKLEDLFRKLLEILEELYDQSINEGYEAILKEWRSFAGFLGKHIEVVTDNHIWVGKAADIDEEGALLVELEDGALERILVGDVSIKSNSA